MAKVIKPSVSPEHTGQRPKKKSPVEDFSGALAVQAGKTIGNQPARTASAEGQTNKTAILAAVSGHGRRPNPSPSSSVAPSPGPNVGDAAVRPASVRREAASQLPRGAAASPGAPVSSRDAGSSQAAHRAVGAEQGAFVPPRDVLNARGASQLGLSLGKESPQAPETREVKAAQTLKAPDGLTRETQARPEARLEYRPDPVLRSLATGNIPMPSSGPGPLPAAAAPSVPAPQIVRAQTGTPLTQIAQLIVSRAPDAGQVKAEITLYPEHLGTVQVQLSVDPSGALSAVVSASQAAVLQLGGSIADLQAALQSSGLDLADLDLRSFPEGSREQQQDADRTVVQLAEAAPESSTPAALIDGGSYLDVTL